MRMRFERVAAAAGARSDCTGDADTLPGWRRAALILLDARSVTAVAARQPLPRGGIIVVADVEMTAQQWEACVALGVQQVHPPGAADEELVRLVADGAAGAAPAGGAAEDWPGRVIAVIGACGGAGATVLACAIALAAQRRSRPVLLCDLDRYGAGIEVTAGMERQSGAHWADIGASRGRLAADTLHGALPALPGGRTRLSVVGYGGVREPVPVETALAVLDAGRRAGDIVVVDAARRFDPVAEAVLARADLTVLVAPADVRGCYAAVHTAGPLMTLGAAAGLVVRGPAPGGVSAAEIAATVGFPLICGMRPEPGLDRGLDAGRCPGRRARGPLGRAAAEILTRAEQQRW